MSLLVVIIIFCRHCYSFSLDILTPPPAWSSRPGGTTTSPHCSGTFTGCASRSASSSGYVCWSTGVCMAPSYLADDLQLTSTVGTRRQLRSADSPTVVVRFTRRSTLGDRAFPVAAVRAWNSLPPAVRDALSLLSFRSRLKTWLFELTLA